METENRTKPATTTPRSRAGGARPGAGRKPDLAPLRIRLDETRREQLQLLVLLARARATPDSPPPSADQVVSELIDAAWRTADAQFQRDASA